MITNFSLFIPEWLIAVILVVFLASEILRPKTEKKWHTPAGWIALLVVVGALFYEKGRGGTAFGSVLILDPFSYFFKIFFAVTAALILQTSRKFFAGGTGHSDEFFLILWISLLGFFFLVSANDLLFMFIALEIVTLSFYVMAAYLRREMGSIEAGLKYLILGSLASAFFIFGTSLLYAATGSTGLAEIRDAFLAAPGHPLLLLGSLLIISALGFKIASVPFHLWVPDIYEGAPTPVVAFLAVGSKAAGFAVLVRLLFSVFLPLEPHRPLLFSFLAAATLLYGNLGALAQTNIKRLFGYSGIGHAGYLLIAVAAGRNPGIPSLLYYLMAYGTTNLAAFYVITLAGKALHSDRIDAYAGLSKRSPWLAAAMFVALLSLAGVPPLAGFFGKFLVLLAAVQSNLAWLALLGALTVAVSLYYYLSVIKTMYVREPADPSPLPADKTSGILLAALSLLIIGMGLFQAPFLGFAERAARVFF